MQIDLHLFSNFPYRSWSITSIKWPYMENLLTFNDFLESHSEGALNWPHIQLGLVILKQGIFLSSQKAFRESIQRLQQIKL